MSERFFRLRPLLWLLLLGSLAACTPAKPDRNAAFAHKWRLQSFAPAGAKPMPVDSLDGLTAAQNHTLGLKLNAAQMNESGTWALAGDTAVFSLKRKLNGGAPLDSLAYVGGADGGTIDFYSKGKRTLSQANGKLVPATDTLRFKIRTLSDDRLVLVGMATADVYQFVPAVSEQAGNISLTGVLNGLLGIAALTLIGFLLSEKRRQINWALIGKAIVLQIIFAFFVLKVPFFRSGFVALSGGFVSILEFTRAGSTFLFGGLVSDTSTYGFIFVFQVLPTIIFFAALTSAFFYLGILQYIVYGFAWVMNKLMQLSGAESLASAANIFVGQTEAPLVIKPYIAGMTRSETMALMTGGMAHISGGVLAAYIGFLGGTDPEQQRIFATHLLSASIMTAPGTFFAAKLLIPETEAFNKDVTISKDRIGSSILDAIANGTTEGLRLAVNVAAMLLVFIALTAMLNSAMLNWIGGPTGWNEQIRAASHGRYEGLTLQYVLGWVFAPLSYLIGIRNWNDMLLTGQLLGQKTILNEFVAYVNLGKLKDAGMFMSNKTVIIATYALCGFANFASIGIQLGGIGTLAPSKRPILASLGLKALIGGTIANLMSATIAGMLM